MSGWLNNLKNLQGHITEFASEVLNEATEEVADPESELQVIKRRCTELEEKLKEAEAKRESAENQKGEFEEKLLSTHYEMDAIGSRYGNLIAVRDEEIKKLKVELEQIRSCVHEEDVMDEDMKEERIEDLKKEVAHWKSLVVQGGPDANGEKIRRQKDQEIAALIQMHEDKLQEQRDHYEEKLAMHTQQSAAASSSESSEAMLDAVLLEKEELMEEKRRLENELARRKDSSERAVLVDVGERDEGSTTGRLREAEEEVERLRRQVDNFAVKESELEQLRLVNNELTSSYNELNGELEVFKQREGRAAHSNRDLMLRIDALKADVIEYEERYELCKRENADTLKQLEKLTADFDRLRRGIDETKYRAEQSDNAMANEVDKLRSALETSKEDRDKLRRDVAKFKGSIDSIDAELQLLRDANNRLTEENLNLSGQLDEYGGSMTKVLDRSENDMKGFREEFEQLQQLLKDKEEEFEIRERDLNETIEELENKNKEFMDERLARARTEVLNLLPPIISGSELMEGGEKKEGEEVRDSRVEVQLREALCANTEITDENERLRQEKDDLEKEISMRQSCIDEMIQQTSVLQASQQVTAQTVQSLRKDISDKEKQLREAEVRSVHDKEAITLLESELDVLKTKICESVVKDTAEKGKELDDEEKREKEIEELKRRIEEGEKKDEERRNEIEDMKRRMEEAERNREETESRLSSLPSPDRLNSLEAEVNQLKTIAMQKHEESLAYYEQLQTSSAEIQRLQSLVENSAQQSDELKKESERREKMERELHRLKEHLVMVEEQSVIEAREAEERETRLLQKVRTLEATQSATITNAEETTQSSQARISALEISLRAAECDARENREKAERSEKEREETRRALESLQGVVRDLASEHDRDTAYAAHESMQLREQLKIAESSINTLRMEMDRLSLDKQSAEDAAVMAREAVETKQKVIEELEIRLEEAHSTVSAKATASSSQYRIDDSTLRQLFLSYFLSPIDRRADIAILLASILEYPQDEMEKVKSAINSSIGKGSTKAMGGSSITEQFIRFLETESESARTAPQLPVRTERSVMSGESINPTQSIESSSSLLRDIFKPIDIRPSSTVPPVPVAPHPTTNPT
ncbi:sql-1 [Pristionchus pacificus]|nr:sql-1 [Pristionchus pacificus]